MLVFLSLQTQWRRNMMNAPCLDYAAVSAVLNLQIGDPTHRRKLFCDIQLMELNAAGWLK